MSISSTSISMNATSAYLFTNNLTYSMPNIFNLFYALTNDRHENVHVLCKCRSPLERPKSLYWFLQCVSETLANAHYIYALFLQTVILQISKFKS